MKFGKELLEGLLSPVKDIISTLDTRDEKIAAFQSRWETAYKGIIQLFEAQSSVIRAEAGSQHWLTATWRPITMLTLVFIVANNYIFAPYLGAMFGWSVTLDIPPQMWTLIHLGVGGYVGGRSLEKIVDAVGKNFGKMK